MTPHWHGNPQRTAECILAQVRNGNVRTRGQYVALVSTVNSLPWRLRSWLWRRLEQEIGHDSVSYLKQWSSATVEVPA
ncbi:MAG: hypothetical protein WCE46_03940 [Methanoregula sp.]|uniref:hypothetical protein n=1 Tax=Methanoregula sp. TaxID=2052170 RepID=UPI003C751332